MKSEFEEYMETGILGAYHKESAINRMGEDGCITVFRDTRYTNTDEICTKERMMSVGAHNYRVVSVFPTMGATPTDKLLSYIEKDLEK